MAGTPSTPDELFADSTGLAIYARLVEALADLSPEVRTTKSQVAFRHRKGFAFLWPPGRYVASTVPAVLSVALPRRLDSDRFKEVVHPAAHTWMHHLEVRSPDELDDEVLGWLLEAYDAAR